MYAAKDTVTTPHIESWVGKGMHWMVNFDVAELYERRGYLKTDENLVSKRTGMIQRRHQKKRTRKKVILFVTLFVQV